MSINEEIGSYLRIETEDGFHEIALHESHVVRKAFKDWRERGIDKALELEHRMGFILDCAASDIVSFAVSSPELREQVLLEELRVSEWYEQFQKVHAVKEWEA